MPTLTDVKISSNACLLLGADNINSMDDGTVEAQAASAFFETTLRALLCERRWSFAVKQAQFTQLVATPIDGYQKVYQIPSDLLKLQKLYPEYVRYEMFGTKYIYADYDGVLIGEYMYRPPLDALPDFFIELLEYRLAMKFCMPITEDEKRLATISSIAKDVEIRAKRADAQQRKYVKIPSSSLIDARA